MNNKKELVIGVVGGMGSYATLGLFERLLESFPANKEWERPRIIIDNYCTMPSRVRAVLYHEKENELMQMLSDSIKNLIRIGCTHIVLACNTSHIFLQKILLQESQLRPFVVDIIEKCHAELKKESIKEFSILATEGTIESKLYDLYFNDGISVFYPSKDQFSKIRHFIEVVKTNSIDYSECEQFFNFIEDMQSTNVLLGCTELPLLFRKGKEYGLLTTKKIFDPLESVIVFLKKEFEIND